MLELEKQDFHNLILGGIVFHLEISNNSSASFVPRATSSCYLEVIWKLTKKIKNKRYTCNL
jgi:hypothetical protein